MTVFALMDEWIACTGRTDDAWLGLGLDLLEAWQTGAEAGHPTHCQGHLAAVLAELRTLRAVAVAPDPVALAAWFHHCGRLHSSLLDRLAEVGGPALGVRVGWLVRGLEAAGSRSEDPAAVLLLTAHRRAQVGSRLAPVRAASPDQ